MKIEVSPGELLDRLTIIEIKLEKITDPARCARLERDRAALLRARGDIKDPEVDRLAGELKTVNTALWRIEDDLRAHEQRRDFGATFVELARAVYFNNDRRAALKRMIDEQLGSALTEEKSYPSYR